MGNGKRASAHSLPTVDELILPLIHPHQHQFHFISRCFHFSAIVRNDLWANSSHLATPAIASGSPNLKDQRTCTSALLSTTARPSLRPPPAVWLLVDVRTRETESF